MLDRRTLLHAAAASALLLPMAGSLAAPLTSRRKPPRLRPGDTVGLVSPAYFTSDSFDLDQVQATIRAMGMVPRLAPHLLSRYGYLAGTDEERAGDLNAMFADREVKAIFCVRGGWGCARILPHLNWELIRANAKLLVGFSDITALHLALAARTDCPSIHGPTASSAWGRLSWDSFRAPCLRCRDADLAQPAQHGRPSRPAQRIRTLRPGRRLDLLGGNLTVLTALVGTPFLPSFEGAVLFIEDTDEAQYRIDRMLTQLSLAGILGRVAGAVFGQCTDCVAKDSSSIGASSSRCSSSIWPRSAFPPFRARCSAMSPISSACRRSIRAEIDAVEGTIRILEPVVA